MIDWAEFRHFKYLLAIAEYMGYRAAAEHLNTAEPNLSIQAKRFQERFGIHLFRRGSNGRIQLTRTGVAFKVLARRLLKAREDTMTALVAIDRGEIGSLTFGSASCINRDVFAAACDFHKEIVPSCSIRPVHGDSPHLIEELVSGSVDAAIVTTSIEDPRIHMEEIRRESVNVCIRADHPLAKYPVLEPKDLRTYPIVRCDPKRNPLVHFQLTAYLESAGIQRTEYARASHPSEVRTLVKEGFGFALVREGNVDEPELTTRSVVGANWTLGSSLAYRKQRFPKTVPLLVEHLRQKFAKDYYRAPFYPSYRHGDSERSMENRYSDDRLVDSEQLDLF